MHASHVDVPLSSFSLSNAYSHHRRFYILFDSRAYCFFFRFSKKAPLWGDRWAGNGNAVLGMARLRFRQKL